MRVFAISDLHIDHRENMNWLINLSGCDYKEDILIFAGDLTDIDELLCRGFNLLKKKFSEVIYIPGNHELWIHRNNDEDSFKRMDTVYKIASDYGINTKAYHFGNLSIIPLLGWYDYSFGKPSKRLLNCWTDYKACYWPDSLSEEEVTKQFLLMNKPYLGIKNNTVITLSHFLPRIDIMPEYVPDLFRYTWPALGTNLLTEQLEIIKPQIHIYGHSHINRRIVKDEICFINNAFGYPYETRISRKDLMFVFEV